MPETAETLFPMADRPTTRDIARIVMRVAAERHHHRLAHARSEREQYVLDLAVAQKPED